MLKESLQTIFNF